MKYWNQTTVDKIRRGYYSAVYFNRTKAILEKEKNFKKVTMQIFQRHEGSVLCGVEEVLEVVKVASGYYEGEKWIDKSQELTIKSLQDGNKLSGGETVMHITGPYIYFAHLESIYLGILARRTLVATNTRKAVVAAAGKSVIFFADRFDYFLNQEGDGYAAKIGGASGVCTPAHEAGFGKESVGTIPHALIALYGSDTIKAAEQFHRQYPEDNLIALVDFNNDCVRTSLEVARRFGKKLWGVRLDTAGDMVDFSLQETSLLPSPTRRGDMRGEVKGVNPTLVKLVRQALDQEGFGHVKIIASGGFNAEKIKWFEKEKTPVDVYGVGSALVHGENDFTADIVRVEGMPMSKVGRTFKANSRLTKLF